MQMNNQIMVNIIDQRVQVPRVQSPQVSDSESSDSEVEDNLEFPVVPPAGGEAKAAEVNVPASIVSPMDDKNQANEFNSAPVPPIIGTLNQLSALDTIESQLRARETPNCPLFSWTDMVNYVPGLIDTSSPTICSPGYMAGMNLPALPDDESTIFTRLCGSNYQFLRQLPDTVYVAGGALMSVITLSPINDIDLFIIERTKEGVLIAAEKVINLIKKHYSEYHNIGGRLRISEQLTTGVYTITVDGIPVPIQIILRTFPSLSAMLYGFDLPICSIAMNGSGKIFMTEFAVYAIRTRTMPLNPGMFSPSFVHRIIKYYNNYGMAIQLPHLKMTGETLYEFERFYITVEYQSGNLMYGSIVPQVVPYESDYNSAKAPRCPSGKTYKNFVQSGNIEKFYIVTETVVRSGRPRNILVTGTPLRTLGMDKDGLMNKKTILDSKTFRSIRDPFEYKMANFHPYFAEYACKYFGIDKQGSDYIMRKMADARINSPGSRIQLENVLAPYTTEIQSKYDALPDKISVIIESNYDGKCFTTTLNCKFQTPLECYRNLFVEHPAPATPTQTIEFLTGVINGNRILPPSNEVKISKNMQTMCSICIETIKPGDENVVTLRCGHVFHHLAENNSGCGGISAWLERHHTCPNCRQDVSKRRADHGKKERERKERQPIML